MVFRILSRNILFTLFLFVLAAPVFSHFHWIEPVDFDPKNDGTCVFHIRSGHTYAGSELLLRKDLIESAGVLKGVGFDPADLSEDGKSWKGNVKCPADGITILEFKLKKRTGNVPFYCGRSIVRSAGLPGGEKVMITGEGLEIVPEGLLKRGGDGRLTFRVYSAGKPVRAGIILVREGEKAISLQPDEDGAIRYRAESPGRYLAGAKFESSGASLTFFINE